MLIVILEKTRFVVKKKKIQLTQIKTIIRWSWLYNARCNLFTK